MAKQLGERCHVSQCFSDVQEMLRIATPQVVHITTPPQSHFQLARQCLEFGSHVYIEKPFTVTAAEAEGLIQSAEERGLKVTAGHNYQFTLEMMEMRRLVREGFLGGPPAHVESYWSYDLGDISYVAPMVSNSGHWVRQLPGQLFHNLISHGLAKVAEFLSAGVNTVCVVDPDRRDVTLFHPDRSTEKLFGDQLLSFPLHLPGFSVPVSRLFG